MGSKQAFQINPELNFTWNTTMNRNTFPTFWKYAVNKPLIGRISDFDSFEHDLYGKQETVIVELKSGELVSAILNDYLINGMRCQNGAIGDLIRIDFQGKERSKNGKTFNKFNMIIQKMAHYQQA